MRRIVSLFSLILLVGISLIAAAKIPRKAPEFVITQPDGKQVLLSSYRGKTVVLAFMFTTCPHCQHTAQILAGVQSEYAAKGVQVLGAAFDEGAAFRIAQFNRQFGINFPCGYSARASVLEFLQHSEDEPAPVPILVFVDKNGVIRSQHIDDQKYMEKQEVSIRAELDKLLKSGPVSTTSAAHKKSPKS